MRGEVGMAGSCGTYCHVRVPKLGSGTMWKLFDLLLWTWYYRKGLTTIITPFDLVPSLEAAESIVQAEYVYPRSILYRQVQQRSKIPTTRQHCAPDAEVSG